MVIPYLKISGMGLLLPNGPGVGTEFKKQGEQNVSKIFMRSRKVGVKDLNSIRRSFFHRGLRSGLGDLKIEEDLEPGL